MLIGKPALRNPFSASYCRPLWINCFVDPLLQLTAHRPWPLPAGPWIMQQIWHDLLFAHWPIPVEAMRLLVPRQLPLDTFDGQCWIGIVPFRMSGVRARGLPPIPGLSSFPELNVRTYVTYGGKAGVYFFSLDAANLPAVWAARTFYHLRYFPAKMSCDKVDGSIRYRSWRRNSGLEFRGTYSPTSQTRQSQKGAIEHWLTERYCLYTVHEKKVLRGEIHHDPWPLQDAQAEFEINTMAAAAGLSLPASQPLLHFSRTQEVLIWPLRHAEAQQRRV